MPTRTEIIEAGARALNAAGWTCAGGLHEPGCFDICKECRKVSAEVTEAALSAMLPLIKAQMVAEVRELHQPVSKLLGRGWGERIGEVASFCNRCHQSLHPCATIRLVEGFEL